MVFADLTVIDLATLGAAPQIAAFFGDFGARVIKVEAPHGDGLRQLRDRRGTAVAWKVVNRNKQCVTLDLNAPAGRELLESLLTRADLVVCALSAARLERWGLNDEQIAQRHPRLVVVNLTTYGSSGPWAARPGSGTLAEAVTGLAALSGPADAPPSLSPVGLGDYLGVLQGIIAALLGLYARDAAHDSGRLFDVAMYEPLLGLLSQRMGAAVRDGAEPGRHGNRFPTMAPRNVYRAGDGAWVALTAGTDELVRRLFTVIGRPELAQDARFKSNRDRLAHVADLDAIIAEWIAARSADEVVAAFTGAGVSLAKVDGVLTAAANPHFRARNSLVDVADGEGGLLTMAAPSPHGVGGAVRHLGRDRGADNLAVYRDWLGVDEARLAALAGEGVI